LQLLDARECFEDQERGEANRSLIGLSRSTSISVMSMAITPCWTATAERIGASRQRSSHRARPGTGRTAIRSRVHVDVNVDAASTGARDRPLTCRLFDRLVVQHVARDHREPASWARRA